MLRHVTLTLLSASLLSLGLFPGASQAQSSDASSLYERMGGYDVIAAFVDDFFVRFDEDPELVPYLGGVNAPAAARIRQHFVDFVCARTGGPCLYNGRDMRTSHEGLGISRAHFEAVIEHMEDALVAQDVPSREREELLTMFRAMESRIVAG